MRQTKRKFVALSTALAMALVLVASLVPSIGARAADTYDQVNVSFTAPNAGVEIKKVEGEYFDPTMPWYSQDPAPASFMTISTDGVEPGFEGFWVVKPDYATGTQDDWFFGTLQSGQIVYCFVDLNCFESGKEFSEDTIINLSGAEIVSKEVSQYGVDMVLKVTISGDDPSPTPDPDTPSSDVPTIDNGSTVEVAPAEDGTVTFRFEKDLEYFENGGKLYIDGQEVPTGMYKATRGSTIITLFKEYAAKLADGAEHAVKVVFNDNTSVEGKIVVKAASSDSSASTAANGTSGTASSTAATTTKVTSPKTADVLPIAGIALVFVGATAIGVIAFRRKNS